MPSMSMYERKKLALDEREVKAREKQNVLLGEMLEKVESLEVAIQSIATSINEHEIAIGFDKKGHGTEFAESVGCIASALQQIAEKD